MKEFWQINISILYTYKNCNDFNLPNDFGIFPSNLLSYKSMLISAFKFPSSLGIFPLNSFPYNSLKINNFRIYMYQSRVMCQDRVDNEVFMLHREKNTYRYCRWCRWLSSEPRVPETLEFPKSLKYKDKTIDDKNQTKTNTMKKRET